MIHLLNQLKTFSSLSTEAVAALENCFEKIIISKGDFLLKEGKICKHLYFLEKGAVRGFYTIDGKEITHWFGFENDFVTSFYSFSTEKPAVENIQALEYATFWGIPKATITKLFEQHRDIESLVRIGYEKYYIRLEDRFVNAQFKTAKELYENLLLLQPHILERVPLGFVASYLGITQETLSRIRNKY
jgi:CRP-like cAMP-binding protein